MSLRRSRCCCCRVSALPWPLSARRGQLPADLDSMSFARLPYVQRKDMDEPAKALRIFERRPRQPSGRAPGPLAFAAYNIPVAKALLDLHDAAVGKGTSNPHVRELAILVASRATDYDLEWNAHQPARPSAGVAAEVIEPCAPTARSRASPKPTPP